MLFFFALFATATYGCCEAGMPIVGFLICSIGMLTSYWLGLCRGLSEVADQIGQPNFRPRGRTEVLGYRPEPRVINEETD
jgi:hypothetical protein